MYWWDNALTNRVDIQTDRKTDSCWWPQYPTGPKGQGVKIHWSGGALSCFDHCWHGSWIACFPTLQYDFKLSINSGDIVITQYKNDLGGHFTIFIMWLICIAVLYRYRPGQHSLKKVVSRISYNAAPQQVVTLISTSTSILCHAEGSCIPWTVFLNKKISTISRPCRNTLHNTLHILLLHLYTWYYTTCIFQKE